MTKKTTVIVQVGLIAIIAIVATTAILKNRAKSKPVDNTPVPTAWRDSSLWVSPFTAVRYDGDNMLVTYTGTEYQLAAINGVSTPDIVGFAHVHYRDQWQKRCAEDLIATLGEMGHPVGGQTVSLSLVDPANGQNKDIADAKMTAENRNLLRNAMASATATAKP